MINIIKLYQRQTLFCHKYVKILSWTCVNSACYWLSMQKQYGSTTEFEKINRCTLNEHVPFRTTQSRGFSLWFIVSQSIPYRFVLHLSSYTKFYQTHYITYQVKTIHTTWALLTRYKKTTQKGDHNLIFVTELYNHAEDGIDFIDN